MFSKFTQAADADRQQQQQQLDAECQAARSKLIAPLKEQHINECIATEKTQEDPTEYCNRFYSDCGERFGNRPAMYMDLPACEKSFEYAQSAQP